jgi:hypothetical protein
MDQHVTPLGLTVLRWLRRWRWDRLGDVVCRYGFAGSRGFHGLILEPDVMAFDWSALRATRARALAFWRGRLLARISLPLALPDIGESWNV